MIRITPSAIGVIPIAITIARIIAHTETYSRITGIPPVVSKVNAGSPAIRVVIIPVKIGVIRGVVTVKVIIGVEPADAGCISIIVVIVGVVVVIGYVGCTVWITVTFAGRIVVLTILIGFFLGYAFLIIIILLISLLSIAIVVIIGSVVLSFNGTLSYCRRLHRSIGRRVINIVVGGAGLILRVACR
jgi:hypothetical protein